MFDGGKFTFSARGVCRDGRGAHDARSSQSKTPAVNLQRRQIRLKIVAQQRSTFDCFNTMGNRWGNRPARWISTSSGLGAAGAPEAKPQRKQKT